MPVVGSVQHNPVGFGGDVNAASWAKVVPFLGTTEAVRDPASWVLSVVSGADRTVSIGPGAGINHGVYDETTAADTLQLDLTASATWWAITQYVKQSTRECVFRALKGGSKPESALGMLVRNPGVETDLLIGLARVDPAKPSAQQITLRRMRRYTGKTVVVEDDAGLSGIPYGEVVARGGALYWTEPSSSGAQQYAVRQVLVRENVSLTFNSLGVATYTHNLGFRPSTVIANQKLTAAATCLEIRQETAASGTTGSVVTLRARITTTGAIFQGAVGGIDLIFYQ